MLHTSKIQISESVLEELGLSLYYLIYIAMKKEESCFGGFGVLEGILEVLRFRFGGFGVLEGVLEVLVFWRFLGFGGLSLRFLGFGGFVLEVLAFWRGILNIMIFLRRYYTIPPSRYPRPSLYALADSS